jgi:threonylcarbamoyladenosine tRNA methylthiotransferase MtaB
MENRENSASPVKKTFKVATLGCRTNQYESQAYHDQLIALGFQPAREDETADLCIVNTCTVTESADSHSRHQIRQFARQNPGAKLAVTGCLAERQPHLGKEIEGVTHLISNKDKENLLSHLFPDQEIPEFSIKNFDAHTRAFIKVQDGCNSFCTYCILPYVRGRSRSRSIPDIVREAETLIQNGYKEIVLTGINIGDFNGDPENEESPKRLPELVHAIDTLPGLKRLRLSSIDPDEVDDALMDVLIHGKNTCPSLHLVLQSGSNIILKRMNRKYTRPIFLDTVEKLKKANPFFTFTTDVIVGFPGETEEDFAETLAVMREVKFAKVHMFPYSVRPRTRAALFPDKISAEVIKVRKQIVLRLVEEMAFSMRERYVSSHMEVLTETRDAHTGRMMGHTENFLPVWIDDPFLESNQIIKVELVANTPMGLEGCKSE